MNQRIGYARVSSDGQNLDLQRDALRLAGVGTIYEEAASGKNAARPELEQCRKALRAGDTLVVWRLDRLGRSVSDLVQIVTDLEQRGVGFESLTEKIDYPSGPGQNAHQQAGYMFAVEPNLHLRHLAKPGTFIHDYSSPFNARPLQDASDRGKGRSKFSSSPGELLPGSTYFLFLGAGRII